MQYALLSYSVYADSTWDPTYIDRTESSHRKTTFCVFSLHTCLIDLNLFVQNLDFVSGYLCGLTNLKIHPHASLRI